MSQQWLSVLGIALDFAGFALLLREWWLAFFNEGRQLEMEEQLERARAMRNLRPRDPNQRNPFETPGARAGRSGHPQGARRPPRRDGSEKACVRCCRSC